MAEDPVLSDLVQRARAGDQGAWNALVDRYSALLWSVCRRYRMPDADAEDVCATVWLRLIEHLSSIRNVQALPGWLATTTSRECLQVLRSRARQRPVDALDFDRADGAPEVATDLLAAEERSALRTAFAELPERCRRLLALLFGEKAPAYTDIGASMSMPVGAIGPTRARCLERLRAAPAIVALRRSGFESPEAAR